MVIDVRGYSYFIERGDDKKWVATVAEYPELSGVSRIHNRALNQLYAATAAKAESGQFIGPDGKNELKGYPTVVLPVAAARDALLAKRLWLLSEELTGVRPDFSRVGGGDVATVADITGMKGAPAW